MQVLKLPRVLDALNVLDDACLPTGCLPGRFELRYAAAHIGGHDYAFPCDANGRVDLDALSDHDRTEYLFARAVAGRELAWPVVVALRSRA